MSYLTVVRNEIEDLKKIRGWILLYGRRKVGKTFLLRNFIKWDEYITVRRDLSIRSEEIEVKNFKDLIVKVEKLLNKNFTVVIDEFQRLPESIIEDLVRVYPNGKLILSGSSLGVARKIFSPKSPLLGFFTPYKLSLINPRDILLTLSKYYDPIKCIEISSYLRDPWLIPLYDGGNVIDFIYNYSCKYWQIVKALIGEVFAEEERTLTKTYEAILSLLGARIWKIKDIANILYAHGIISEPSSSQLGGFIRNLIEMDLIESIKIYNSKMKYFKLKSPIMETYYYLEYKYDVSERITSLSEVKPVLENLIRFETENFIADLFAEYYNGRREYSLNPEIDFIITRRKNIIAIGEVKWGKYSRGDLRKFKLKVENMPGIKIFITKIKENDYYDNIRIIDANDIIEMIK